MKQGYFDRPISDALKGVALIFMFVHHLFGFPDWYVAGIAYPALAPFSSLFRWPLKICVSCFAFLTGYFFFLGRDKSYRYALRKIRELLVSYWFVYIPCLLLAIGLGCCSFRPGDVLLEAFALKTPVMQFSWYVFFYCAGMLLLPLAAKFSTDRFWTDVLLLGLLPLTVFTALRQSLTDPVAAGAADAMVEWFPCTACGFLFAKYALFQRFLEPMGKKLPSGWIRVLFWLCLAGAACVSRALCPRFSPFSASIHGQWVDVSVNMDVFYAPLFLYSMAKLLSCLKKGIIVGILGKIGRQSLMMWFLHGQFFNVCREYTQPVLYALRNPVLVLVFGLAVCYGGAVLLQIPLSRLLKGRKQASLRP